MLGAHLQRCNLLVFVLLVDTELIYVLNFSRMTFVLLIGQREGSATGING